MISKHANSAKPPVRLVAAALALLLMVFASFVFAQSDFINFKSEYGKSFENKLTGNWPILAMVAVTICIAFNTLLYMMGFMF